MALTGFDPSVVQSSINAVINAYNELMQALGNDMQTQFIVGMSDKWACNEAINFFNQSFKPSIDSLITSSDSTFESVVNSMNSAGRAWAEDTKSSYNPVSFSPRNIKMDTGSIVENIGGVRGIDLANAGTIAAKLPQIASSASSALSNAQVAVQNCGFIGGNQASNLINSLGTIKTKISQATNELTDATKSAIDATVANYGDLEGRVSQAFSTQG